MDTIRDRLIPLEEIPADRRLIEELSAQGDLSPRAREFALDLVYPAKNWGLWISRLLAALGTTLMLAGIVYFYAFNWAAIPDGVKLGSVEAALIACMGATLFRGRKSTSGKFMALATSMLIGVFLAVFGQIYQTGADAWELFAVWAALVIPFGIAAEFAPIWGLWLVVANFGMYFFWAQSHPIRFGISWMVFPYMGAFNMAALAARELLEKRLPWIAARWTRNLPAALSLMCAMTPCAWLAFDHRHVSDGLVPAAAIGATVLLAFYGFYRFVKRDVQTLAATMLMTCVVAECYLFNLLGLTHSGDAATSWLLLGVLTVTLFAGVIVWLRTLTKQLEIKQWLNI